MSKDEPHALIAQITDIHLGFDGDVDDEMNRRRLDAVLADLAALPTPPDLVLATGDLVERGDVASYWRLRDAFARAPFTIHPLVGNHDTRAGFLPVFDTETSDGFVQYECGAGPLRVLVLDTLEEGRHGGAFCEVRAAWLRARLDEQPERPTLIALHHPPVEVGIDWMNTAPNEPWVARLAKALEGHPQVIALVCGHIHRPCSARWQGLPVAISPATSPQLALDLSPVDPSRPDGRALIVEEAPGYALHRWNGRELMSHFVSVSRPEVLARFNEGLQPMIAEMMAERAR